MPVYGTSPKLFVNYVCAFFIIIFCFAVFLFFMTPDLINHWKGPPVEIL